MPQIVEIRKADDPRDVIHRACQLLSEGRLVAFPTETSYIVAASSASEAGVQAIRRVSDAESVFLLKDWFELLDFVRLMPAGAEKLARRAWPGPLTMKFEIDSLGRLYPNLPAFARQRLEAPAGMVGFRVAYHEALTQVQQLCPIPLMATSDVGMDRPLPRTPDDIVSRFGDAVSLIIDDGPSRYGEPTTSIEWHGDRWSLIEQGVISALNLERLMSNVYLFVCTGNTCRSPMAEALFRAHLMKRLGCDEDELMDRGYAVVSAGLAANSGMPASPQAIAVLSDDGIDLRSHESQPLTKRLLQHADQIFTMTQGHLASIVNEFPELAHRVRTLSPNRSDITDPYGGDRREYEVCKNEIERHIVALVEQLAVNQRK